MKTSIQTIPFSIALLIFISLISSVIMAGEYYVAPNGSDSNPGTYEYPWQTIQRANQLLQTGDTVFIRQGYYKGTIQPSNNGIELAPIIYTCYQKETPVIHYRPEGANLSGSSYIIINGIHFENCNYFVRSYPKGFDHCVIKNCVMKNQTGWCGIEIGDGCSYNKIINNFIDNKGVEGDCIHIGMDTIGEEFGAKYNLVAYNECTGAKHSGICCAGDKTQFNIIRDNYIHDIGDINIVTGALTSWVLIEGNRCHNPGMDPDGACAIQIRSEHSIIRKNILSRDFHLEIDQSGAAMEFQSTNDRPFVRQNKIYNNVIYNFNQGRTLWNGIKLSVYNKEIQFGPNIFKNNIIYKNGTGDNKGYQIAFSRVVDIPPIDRFDANLISAEITGDKVIYFFEYEKQQLSLTQAKQQYPDIFLSSNIDASPLFVDEQNFDFHLQKSSPCIDAAAFLTKTTFAGSGDQIRVENAGYFCDGWGIVEGDLIKIGSRPPVQIISIDYSNNLIKINQPIAWQQEEPVSLDYSGSSPDIGAYEFYTVDDALAPFPPQNVKVSDSF
jgi:hypothetical protein